MATLEPNPSWYKDAIIYELHVRAFFDNDGDGVGDVRGLTDKLDYLQDLGVTALWLLPFYPSPLKDDGYDIADYTDIHPTYGNLHDFNVFLKEAHRRGIRVITELVLNHTSDQHPWFQRARRAKPGSRDRNFYVWSDSPEKYREARIIFKDFESSNWTWDPLAKAYYWHRFYAHQPDLNFDHPAVRKAVTQVLDQWFELGVDGMRLDAVPYLYERDGTTCENLPDTHAFLKELRRHVDQRFADRMLLAEANQWPEDAIAYFGGGDECHMAFHFPLMPRLFMAIRMESRFPLIEIFQQTPLIPDLCQWALFLRNHDELTLEMVTDEERDYMYRVYARDRQARLNLGIRRRLAPLLGNDRRKIELMNGLLFSMPGTPVLYYGDEIGMGDNIYLGDRNGVRTPMHWSADRNAGFSRANPQRLYLPVIIDPEYHYEALNVEAQQDNPHSLLWWTKRLIATRRRYAVFGRGTLDFLAPENHKILAFVRRYQDESLLVVANLSRFTQCAELDLSAFKGLVPVELAGRTPFPAITAAPYFLTLGGYGLYWFLLEPVRAPEVATQPAKAAVPMLTVHTTWDRLFGGDEKTHVEDLLPAFLKRHRWFGGKARTIQAVELTDAVPVSREATITLVHVEYTDSEPETYLLPLAFAADARAEDVLREWPQHVLMRLTTPQAGGVVYDAVHDPAFRALLLEMVGKRRRTKGESGEVFAVPTRAFRKLQGPPGKVLESTLLGAEQSNTSIVYGERCILKLFRRLDEGVNPDLEIGRFLTERRAFRNIPPVGGSLEYRRPRREPMTLAILQGFVGNEGDAWHYTLESLSRYFERVLAVRHTLPDPPASSAPLASLMAEELPEVAEETIGAYLGAAQLLGGRTAELHMALASDRDDPNFAPEPFSVLYQRSLYQSMHNLTAQTWQLLRRRLAHLPEGIRPLASTALALEPELRQRFRSITARKMTALRIRCHGDYHLGQVLYTGKDFIIIDFEGEPARSLSERRIKRSPFRDVAGMLRSFHYAAYTALFEQTSGGGGGILSLLRAEELPALEPWALFWYRWVGVAFLKAYAEVAEGAPFVPTTRDELGTLLNVYLLEKAVYELGYELNNRPEWVHLPLKGILQLLERLPMESHGVSSGSTP